MTSSLATGPRPITRAEAPGFAARENQRVLELLSGLAPADWGLPTDCPDWDVRALAGHLLGAMKGFGSLPGFVRLQVAAAREPRGLPRVDRMTAVEVRANAGLATTELLAGLALVGPRSARARARVPAPLRALPVKAGCGGVPETWRLGYLLDLVLTRDVWMHRVDLARATGRPLVLSADHDGRIVSDVVAEWARRHGRPYRLTLSGPAGGTYAYGTDGDPLELDAVEFCRILSGRSSGSGLLTQEVPF